MVEEFQDGKDFEDEGTPSTVSLHGVVSKVKSTVLQYTTDEGMFRKSLLLQKSITAMWGCRLHISEPNARKENVLRW